MRAVQGGGVRAGRGVRQAVGGQYREGGRGQAVGGQYRRKAVQGQKIGAVQR
jgi:hypothetical protein